MISGVRLTQLAYGEPLLGIDWNYKGFYGKNAVQERLKDLFYNAKNLGFNFIIDTINPTLNIDNEFSVENNGLYSNIWTFEERISSYRKFQNDLNIKLLLEINFPCVIDESNYKTFAYFCKTLMLKYNDIDYWQIGILPEEKNENGEYKCNPITYVKLLREISELKLIKPEIQIGGPGSFSAVIDYVNNVEDNWMSRAVGDVYNTSDSEYPIVGSSGFLEYINFFSFHGMQNKAEMEYNKIYYIINYLREKFNKKTKKQLQFFSTVQGNKADESDKEALELQSYYDLREFLNAFKNGIVPFKNQLIDEFENDYAWGGYFNKEKADYGILYYYLGENGFKPAVDDYFYILNNTDEFNWVGENIDLYEKNKDLDSVTLYNNDPNNLSNNLQTTTVTIIWPKNLSCKSVVLKPHYARTYLLSDGRKGSVTDSLEINFSKTKFIMVFQTLENSSLDIEKLKKGIDKKITYNNNVLAQLINCLPNSYNKEVTDLNYYKLLRAVSLEFADAKINIDQVKDNLYLNNADNEALYNNFGVLVNLNKRPEWNQEKYRRLVKGVIKSLLNGPTQESIIEAIKLFTNFNVNIKEAYKYNNNPNSQFKFYIEIEKPIEFSNTDYQLENDVKYVLNIVKPARSLIELTIALSGKENYKEHYLNKYGHELKDSDVLERKLEVNNKENKYGWKYRDYIGQLKTAGSSVIENNCLINGGLVLGPRYILYDNFYAEANFSSNERYKHILEDVETYLEYNFKDNIKKAEEKSHIHLVKPYQEHKFGLNLDKLIQLNGGPKRLYHKPNDCLFDVCDLNKCNNLNCKNRYINTLKINDDAINLPKGIKLLGYNPDRENFVLGYSTKLNDKMESSVNLSGNEFKEKFILCKIINGFKFPYEISKNLGIDYPINTNGKFFMSPDILSKYDIDIKETTYLTEDRKNSLENLNIKRSFKELFKLNVKEKLNAGPNYKENIPKAKDTLVPHIITETSENYEDVIEELNSYYSKSFTEEKTRSFIEDLNILLETNSEEYDTTKLSNILTLDTLLNEQYEGVDIDRKINFFQENSEQLSFYEAKETNYHIHKSNIKFIQSEFDNYISTKSNDLFEIGSNIKIFVNGMLIPSWAYKEIPSIYDKNYSYHVKFLYKLYEGDIVNIVYLKKKQIVLSQSFIQDDSFNNLDIGTRFENWKVIEKINESYIISHIFSEKFNTPKDNYNIGNIKSKFDEEYEVKNELVVFEGPEIKDFVNWKQNLNGRKRSNLQKLNTNLKMEEKINKPISKSTLKIINDFKDIYKKPLDLLVFNRDFKEINIVSQLNIKDKSNEILIENKDKYIFKDINYKPVCNIYFNDLYNKDIQEINSFMFDYFKEEINFNIKDKHDMYNSLCETLKDVKEAISQRIINNYNEIILLKKTKDVHSFNNNVKENVSWNTTLYPIKHDELHTRLMLNKSKLNNTILYGKMQEFNYYAIKVSEKYETPLEDHNSIVKTELNENINLPILNLNLFREYTEVNKLQNNLNIAFKFSDSSLNEYGKLNISPLAYTNILDNAYNKLEIKENINIKPEQKFDIKINISQEEYIFKKDNLILNINKVFKEKNKKAKEQILPINYSCSYKDKYNKKINESIFLTDGVNSRSY